MWNVFGSLALNCKGHFATLDYKYQNMFLSCIFLYFPITIDYWSRGIEITMSLTHKSPILRIILIIL